jgi:acyl-coenzyme A thioesterase PaaI-like protein
MITRPEIMEGIRRHIQPIGGQENLNILEVEPGHVRLSIELTEACLNLYGNAHGGFRRHVHLRLRSHQRHPMRRN